MNKYTATVSYMATILSQPMRNSKDMGAGCKAEPQKIPINVQHTATYRTANNNDVTIARHMKGQVMASNADLVLPNIKHRRTVSLYGSSQLN